MEGYTTSVQCRQSVWQKISRYAEGVSVLMAVLGMKEILGEKIEKIFVKNLRKF